MIKIIVTGAAGRMGRVLIGLISDDPGLKLVGAIESPSSPGLGTEAGGVLVTSDLKEIVSKCDVVIDFSSADATPAFVEIAHGAGRAMVIGTTGLETSEIERCRVLAKEFPLLMAPNMSVGVNLLWRLTEIAAKTTGKGFSINIEETHHIHKKDAPSGTAKRLMEIAAANSGYNSSEIGIKSIREGEVVGEHVITFSSAGEKLTLAHSAFTREIFARGALVAARWLVGRPAGFYDMGDALFGV